MAGSINGVAEMNCKEQSDAQLYGAWSAGDRRAGGELSKRYLPMLLRFVSHRVSDPTAAKDIVGSALLQLCKSRNSLKDPTQFRAFVMGIAWNALKSHYRKHRHERLHLVGDEHLDLAHPALEDRGFPCSEGPEELGRLVHALRCLPIEDQQLLMACYVEGMSYAKLAVAFNLECGTVASRLNTAKTRLAAAMRALEDEDRAPSNPAKDFNKWAVRIRQGIEDPSLGGILPRRMGRWRLIEFESTPVDSMRGVYRQWPLVESVMELEIISKASAPAGIDQDNITIGERTWALQIDRARDEYAMQTTLRAGPMLRLVHRPTNEWKQVTRFAARLDLEDIERSALCEDDGRDALELARALGGWARARCQRGGWVLPGLGALRTGRSR